jgi:membrane protease YdiL (CAAX protease family)
MKIADQKPSSSRFLVGILLALPLFFVTALPSFVSSLGFKFAENTEKLDLPNFLIRLASSPSGEVAFAAFLTVYFVLILLLVVMLSGVAWLNIFATKRISGTSIRLAGFSQPPRRVFYLGLILVTGVLTNIYFKPIVQVAEYLVGTLQTAPSADNFLAIICGSLAAASISSFFATVVTVIVVPCCEEIFFRGYLYELFSTRLSSFWVWVTTSVLFSIAHFGSHPFAVAYFLQIFVVGSFYFFARKVSGGILWPILCHLAVNLFANIVCI